MLGTGSTTTRKWFPSEEYPFLQIMQSKQGIKISVFQFRPSVQLLLRF